MPTRLTRQQINALSDDELDRLIASYSPTQVQAAQENLVSIFQNPAVEPGEDFNIDNLLSKEGASTALQNLPFSAAERGRELEQVVRHPVETGKSLMRLLGGTGDLAATAFGAEETDNARFAKQAGQNFADSFSPKNVARDPLAPVANIASTLVPFLPKTGALGAIGKAVNVAGDPAVAALGAGAKVGGKVGKSLGRSAGNFAGDAAAQGLGFTTGQGADFVRESFRAGNEGNFGEFARGIGDDISRRDIAQQVRDALTEKRRELGQQKGAFVDQNAEALLDVSDLKEQAQKILEDYDIQVTPRTDRFELVLPRRLEAQGAQASTIEAAAEEIARLGDTVDLKTLDDIKQTIGNMFAEDKVSGAITSRINKLVREKLNTVEGYKEANRPIAELETQLEQLQKDIGLKLPSSKFNKKNVGRAMQRGVSKGREDELGALSVMEEQTGQPIRAQLAAEQAKPLLPTDLFGRSAVVGAGTAAAFGNIQALLPLPLFSPRLVGLASASAGLAGRQLQQFTQTVQRLQQQAKVKGLPQTITLGEAIQRLQPDEEEQRPPSLMSRLGGVR